MADGDAIEPVLGHAGHGPLGRVDLVTLKHGLDGNERDLVAVDAGTDRCQSRASWCRIVLNSSKPSSDACTTRSREMARSSISEQQVPDELSFGPFR
jgi:hypothetical protein